jgi:hypothetical protein
MRITRLRSLTAAAAAAAAAVPVSPTFPQHALERYGRDKGLPQEMKELIEGHLRLNFTTNQEADEQMLATLPTTLRRYVRLMWLVACC